MGFDYEAAYEGLQAELRHLKQLREKVVNTLEDLDQRLGALSVATEALGPVVQSVPIPEVPSQRANKFEVTANIREILGDADSPLSAPELHVKLMRRGWNCDKHKNPLAIIHTVLDRLVKNGDVKRVPGMGRGFNYVAVENDRAARHPDKPKYRGPLDNTSKPIDPQFRQTMAEVARDILRISQKPMSGPALYRALIERGVDMKIYSAPMSALAQVLRRMPDVEAHRAPSGGAFRTFFRLNQGEKGSPEKGIPKT